jgi:hypothetical protein
MPNVTLDMPLPDFIELEILLLSLASYAEAEARTLDDLDLKVCAANARAAVVKARRISQMLKAANPTIAYTRSA